MSRSVAPFWTRVEVTDPDACWLWTGAIQTRGYGSAPIGNGKSALAHRVAYELAVGSIPEAYTIDHLCRVKTCVNPAHLEPVTLRENIRRAYEQDRPTHCPQGHPYTPENVRVKQRSNGQVNRTCITCEIAQRPAKNARARRKAAAALPTT